MKHRDTRLAQVQHDWPCRAIAVRPVTSTAVMSISARLARASTCPRYLGAHQRGVVGVQGNAVERMQPRNHVKSYAVCLACMSIP